MKTMRLTFYRISHYFLQNKLIFILYLLGSVVCVITFLFFYGNLLSVKQIESSDGLSFRSYKVRFSTPQTVLEKQVDALAEFFTGEIQLHADLSKELGALLAGKESGDGYLLSASVDDRRNLLPQQGRTFFTESEQETCAAVLVVPSDNPLSKKREKIKLFGKDFSVIGTATMPLEFSIPFRTYLSLEQPNIWITLVAEKRLTSEQENTLLRKTHELFPNASIAVPMEHFEQGAHERMASELFMISVIYLAAFLCFLFLMKYMMDRNNYENVIYGVVGAKKRYVFWLVLLENGVLSLLAGLLGILIHWSLYSSLFVKINIFEHLVYKPGDYLAVLVLSMLLSGLAMLPFGVRYSRYTLTESRNRYL